MLVNLDYVLKKAQKEKYAVGLFNTTDTDMLEAAISAAEELNSPIIIGTAEVLLPYGELKLIAPSIIAAAKRAKVPVVVHFDHGTSFEKCMEAISLGFSSIMYDGSVHEYETNIKNTQEIVKIAHSLGITVEGEIGCIGSAEGGVDNGEASPYRFTTAEEAKSYAEATGVDALAVAIGSAHGVYKSKPELKIDRLKEIASTVDIPLVLHGGSGLSDDDFRNAYSNGMAKINIFTDLCLAGEKAVKEGLEKGIGYLETRKLKVEYIKQAVMKKIKLFGSVNKA